jgi:hypothetical protein
MTARELHPDACSVLGVTGRCINCQDAQACIGTILTSHTVGSLVPDEAIDAATRIRQLVEACPGRLEPELGGVALVPCISPIR